MTILTHVSPHISTKRFRWEPKEKTFTAEASQLRDCGFNLNDPRYPMLHAVYDDACDEGFTLVSHKTGREIVMVLDKEDRDENYSGGWRILEFTPAKYSERKLFDRVVIFND